MRGTIRCKKCDYPKSNHSIDACPSPKWYKDTDGLQHIDEDRVEMPKAMLVNQSVFHRDSELEEFDQDGDEYKGFLVENTDKGSYFFIAQVASHKFSGRTLPSKFDMDIFLGLVRLVQRRNDCHLIFNSSYDFLKTLGMPVGTTTYRNLKKSMNVLFHIETGWKVGKHRVSKFWPITRMEWDEEDDTAPIEVWINDLFLDIPYGCFDLVNVDKFRKLRGEVSANLFMSLVPWEKQGRVNRRLPGIYKRLGIRNKNPRNRKVVLRKAMEQVSRITNWTMSFYKNWNGEDCVRFTRRPKK